MIETCFICAMAAFKRLNYDVFRIFREGERVSSQGNHQRSESLKLEDFTGGLWSISRQIINHTQDANLTFTGSCEVLDGWYHETGQMVFSDGNFFSSTRRYRWKPCASGVDVHFDDGRFFHQIDLSTNSATATHFCDPDYYTVSYDFTKWPVWTAIWRVRGARKNYEMHSCYRRIAL